jgi:hypothetical protein
LRQVGSGGGGLFASAATGKSAAETNRMPTQAIDFICGIAFPLYFLRRLSKNKVTRPDR